MDQCTASEIALFHSAMVFKEHAAKDKCGDNDHLSKDELKTLLREEYPNLMQCTNDPDAIAAIMAGLDVNKDQKLDFMEFSVMLITMAMQCKKAMDMCQSKCSK